jgi:hypothetical protein
MIHWGVLKDYLSKRYVDSTIPFKICSFDISRRPDNSLVPFEICSLKESR